MLRQYAFFHHSREKLRAFHFYLWSSIKPNDRLDYSAEIGKLIDRDGKHILREIQIMASWNLLHWTSIYQMKLLAKSSRGLRDLLIEWSYSIEYIPVVTVGASICAPINGIWKIANAKSSLTSWFIPMCRANTQQTMRFYSMAHSLPKIVPFGCVAEQKAHAHHIGNSTKKNWHWMRKIDNNNNATKTKQMKILWIEP